jgi:oligopeptide transport system ATP-binding protein
VEPGQIVCLVGESGSGKSVTAHGVMGLLPKGQLTPVAGRIALQGEDLLSAAESRLRDLRCTAKSMIFQEPMTALNPVMSCGEQIDEVLLTHTDLGPAARRERIQGIMGDVRLPEPETMIDAYPHQLSGGQRQRIMIAMALVLQPALLIADEPTTALDVTTQAQILRLIRDLQRERDTGVLFITHDFGVVAEIADRVAVMQTGRIVEEAPVNDIYATPAHPYTKALLESIPRVDLKGQQLAAIKGLPPPLTMIPPGCSFAPRCRYVQHVCRADPPPPQFEVSSGRRSACHFWKDVRGDD